MYHRWLVIEPLLRGVRLIDIWSDCSATQFRMQAQQTNVTIDSYRFIYTRTHAAKILTILRKSKLLHP